MASAIRYLFTLRKFTISTCITKLTFQSRRLRCNIAIGVPTINSGPPLRKKYGTKFLWAGILTWLGFKEEEDTMILTMKRGVLCLQRGEFDKAETILHLALKVAQERQDMQAQTYIFDLLANVALQKNDYPKAEQLFKQVIKELIANGTPTDHNSIVELSLKLASAYSEMKEDFKAEEGFKFCIVTQEKKLNLISLSDTDSLTDMEKDTAILWAMSVDFYARHLFERNFFREAESNFQKALNISEKINGPSHPQTLTLISNLGSISSLLKDYDKAIQYFQRAIKMSTDSNDLPVFYCNLGVTYIRKGNAENATEACTTALQLSKAANNSEAETEAKECLLEVHSIKAKK